MLATFRFATRQLAKSPAFTFIAVLTLALGIGSATTAFTAVNALLLRPLPLIQQQQRMLYLDQSMKGEVSDISFGNFAEWRKRTRTLESLWVFDERTVILSMPNEPVWRFGSGITSGAFTAMGVAPTLGRDFRPEEDLPGAPDVAILGHDLWRSRFGGTDDVLGQTVKLNGKSHTIVGVMPKGWRFPEVADLWMPLKRDPADALRNGYHDLNGHGMLKAGVTLEQARA